MEENREERSFLELIWQMIYLDLIPKSQKNILCGTMYLTNGPA